MVKVWFKNVDVLDATGALPFPGQVLVEDNRIAAVVPDGVPLAVDGARVVDGHGATLMPGLIESHAHLSFTDIRLGTDLGNTPPEEHTLRTAACARTLLQHGFTSCVSAASAKPRLDGGNAGTRTRVRPRPGSRRKGNPRARARGHRRNHA